MTSFDFNAHTLAFILDTAFTTFAATLNLLADFFPAFAATILNFATGPATTSISDTITDDDDDDDVDGSIFEIKLTQALLLPLFL